jgi:hypothetical protein
MMKASCWKFERPWRSDSNTDELASHDELIEQLANPTADIVDDRFRT